MQSPDTTCWTVIDAASKGRQHEREEFARRYEGPVRAYLVNRWRHSHLSQNVDDAVQEVFLECFRADGPLQRAERDRPGGFRPYLYGIVRNVARAGERRYQTRAAANQTPVEFDAIASDETQLSIVFDRAWAKSIMQQATSRQAELAKKSGPEAVRRFELLALRFQEGLPIREIAKRWGVEAADLHREQTKAKREFQNALLDVLAFHHPGSEAEIRQQAELMLQVLS